MPHYDFPAHFRKVYQRALAAYAAGCRQPDALLDTADQKFASEIGSRTQDFFDYAEDAAKYGEPDFETTLLVQSLRRDYFLLVQKGTPSSTCLDPQKMPAKTDAVRGIEWLPRLMPKTLAKLRGELPEDLMYGCAGDRRFFRRHDIHPAEFLRAAWHFQDAPAAWVDWVAARSPERP